MQNGIFTFNWATIADSAVMAAVAAVIVGVVGIVQAPNFDLFAANWAAIGHSVANWGVIAFVITFGQDFLSTKQGSVLNITPAN